MTLYRSMGVVEMNVEVEVGVEGNVDIDGNVVDVVGSRGCLRKSLNQLMRHISRHLFQRRHVDHAHARCI